MNDQSGQALRRLAPSGIEVVQDAVSLCRADAFGDVEIGHLVLAMINRPGSSPSRALKDLDVSIDRLRVDLMQDFSRPKRGGGGASPRLSLGIADVLSAAWSAASLEDGAADITDEHLLRGIRGVGSRWKTKVPSCIRSLDADELRETLARHRPEETTPVESRAGPGTGSDHAADDALATYCQDLTAAARAGLLDPVVGRDDEIRQLIGVLGRRKKNNPALLGEAGVGKTALVEGFAQCVVAGEVPAMLGDARVLCLDLGALKAGASVHGEFERRLTAVVRGVRQSRSTVVLFIDELHNLIGAGGHDGAGDAANLIKPALARGELRCIGATTTGEFKRHIEKDPALERRFQPIHVEEPDPEAALVMLRTLVPMLESHHEVFIREEGLVAAVELSGRYVHGRNMPDKCIDLLDFACSRVAGASSRKPDDVQRLESRIRDLDLRAAQESRDVRLAGRLVGDGGEVCRERQRLQDELANRRKQWSEERDLVARLRSRQSAVADDSGAGATKIEEIASLRAQLSVLAGEEPLVPVEVDDWAVATAVEAWTGIPAGRMLSRESDVLASLSTTLSKRILGQDEAIQLIADRMLVARARLQEENAPLGVFLLTGSSGIGKTETAIALVETVFRSRDALIRLNMSEFSERHSVATLKGAPPGYKGYGRGGILTEAVRHKPYCVLLLDELDKAHADVHKLLYQVFEQGVLTDSEGRKVSFRNVLVLATTNAGGASIFDSCFSDEEGASEKTFDELRDAATQELALMFPWPLLNRATVVPYRPLGDDVMRGIVVQKLARLRRRLALRARVVIDSEVTDAIHRRCTDPAEGARAIDRAIEAILLPALARVVVGLESRPADPSSQPVLVHVSVTEDGELHCAARAAAPAGSGSSVSSPGLAPRLRSRHGDQGATRCHDS